MIQVAIVCGVSGSGKSTFVNKILPKIKGLMPTIYSADIERIKDGKYVYEPSENEEMHARCRRKFTRTMIMLARNQKDLFPVDALIAVDNSSTTPAEIAYYWDTAKNHGAHVEIYRMIPPEWPNREMDRDPDGNIVCSPKVRKYIKRCVKHNSHDVPKRAIEVMLMRMVFSKRDKLIGYPGWWKFIDVERYDGGFKVEGTDWDLEGK